jgi:hypothetical protein
MSTILRIKTFIGDKESRLAAFSLAPSHSRSALVDVGSLPLSASIDPTQPNFFSLSAPTYLHASMQQKKAGTVTNHFRRQQRTITANRDMAVYSVEENPTRIHLENQTPIKKHQS